MARLPYIAPDAVGDERVEQIYAQIRRYGRTVAHLYQVQANQPAALEAFIGMSHYIRDSSSLPAGLREASILATAQVLDQPYEVAHHRPAALKAGLSTEKIAAILAGRSDGLTPIEGAVVAYAREVGASRDVSDLTFAAVRSHLTEAQTVDLVVTVAWYHLCAAILGPLHVEVEPELRES